MNSFFHVHFHSTMSIFAIVSRNELRTILTASSIVYWAVGLPTATDGVAEALLPFLIYLIIMQE